MKDGGSFLFMSWASLNAWTGQKKGETHSTLAATVIPTLVEMAPQITSAIKSVKKGDASSVFLDGVDPSMLIG